MTELFQKLLDLLMLQKKKKIVIRGRDTYETNAVEHKALFGLLYLAGINRSGHLKVGDFYASDGTVLEFFKQLYQCVG